MGNLCNGSPVSGVQKVAVLGATGQQGGAVAAALSARGVPVVAITRNTGSEKAKALASAPNTQVRKADLNDVASLVKAFEGCDGAFVIANFWEGCDADKEMVQYKNCAEALKKTVGMKHIVYSTLEDTVKGVSGCDDFKTLHTHRETGPMRVPHFDGKNRAEAYFQGLPVTFMVTSCYLENFCSFFSFNKMDDGSYAFTLPLGKKAIPWTILPDLGQLVAGIFENPQLIGKRVGQASFIMTGNELAEMFSKATGKTIKYNEVPWTTFAAFGFPGAEELAQMFEFWTRTHEAYLAARQLEPQRQISGMAFTDPVTYARTLPLQFK